MSRVRYQLIMWVLSFAQTATVDDASFIPSIEFIDTCLYLYFKYFHPHLPVLHQPTFKRDGTPKLLLLSMCSIGCMFIGTADARQRGLEIYERLHHVIIFTVSPPSPFYALRCHSIIVLF